MVESGGEKVGSNVFAPEPEKKRWYVGRPGWAWARDAVFLGFGALAVYAIAPSALDGIGDYFENLQEKWPKDTENIYQWQDFFKAMGIASDGGQEVVPGVVPENSTTDKPPISTTTETSGTNTTPEAPATPPAAPATPPPPAAAPEQTPEADDAKNPFGPQESIQGPNGSDVEDKTKPVEPQAPKASFVSDDNYDAAKFNLLSLGADPVAIDEPTQEDIWGLEDAADDRGVTLSNEEAEAALQSGGFVKDGVTYEVWADRDDPTKFYIAKCDADHRLVGEVPNFDKEPLTPEPTDYTSESDWAEDHTDVKQKGVWFNGEWIAEDDAAQEAYDEAYRDRYERAMEEERRVMAIVDSALDRLVEDRNYRGGYEDGDYDSGYDDSYYADDYPYDLNDRNRNDYYNSRDRIQKDYNRGYWRSWADYNRGA